MIAQSDLAQKQLEREKPKRKAGSRVAQRDKSRNEIVCSYAYARTEKGQVYAPEDSYAPDSGVAHASPAKDIIPASCLLPA